MPQWLTRQGPPADAGRVRDSRGDPSSAQSFPCCALDNAPPRADGGQTVRHRRRCSNTRPSSATIPVQAGSGAAAGARDAAVAAPAAVTTPAVGSYPAFPLPLEYAQNPIESVADWPSISRRSLVPSASASTSSCDPRLRTSPARCNETDPPGPSPRRKTVLPCKRCKTPSDSSVCVSSCPSRLITPPKLYTSAVAAPPPSSSCAPA